MENYQKLEKIGEGTQTPSLSVLLGLVGYTGTTLPT